MSDERTVRLQGRVSLLELQVANQQAVIAAHDLCHDLHGKVGRAEFEEGCRRETIKEYGSCSWVSLDGLSDGDRHNVEALVAQCRRGK